MATYLYETLQETFGTWPSENAYYPPGHSPLGIRESFSFGDLDDVALDESALAEDLGAAFQPRVPNDERAVIPVTFGSPLPSQRPTVRSNSIPSTDSQRPLPQLRPRRSLGNSNVSTLNAPLEDIQDDPISVPQSMEIDIPSRTPSPGLDDADLELERASMWSRDARAAFHEMVTAEGYVNRYRMHMKKRQRLSHYLQHPDLEPMLCDGSKDHQTKYQASNWTLIDNKLYRKPDTGRVGKLRRHLDEMESWDVLTREHLRSGHLGRDKLRKRLEKRYIGYTLQEIMFVLKECKRCGGREKTTSFVPANMDFSKQTRRKSSIDYALDNALPDASSTHPAAFEGRQTSNVMWP
jgi:hypothetical protein